MIRTIARSTRVARPVTRSYSTAPQPVAVPPNPSKIATPASSVSSSASNAAQSVSNAASSAASGAQASAKAAQAGATIGSSAQKLKPRKKSSVRGTLLGFLLGTTLTGFGAYSYLVDQYRQSNNMIIADVIALNGSIRNLEEQVKQLQLKKD